MTLREKVGKRAILAVFLAFAVVAAVPAHTAAASSSVNFDSDAAQNPEIQTDVTKEVHKMDWGTDESAILQYEGDSGDVKGLPATVNESGDNPYSFAPTDVNFSDAREFPHGNDSATWTNSSLWSTTESSVSEVTTAPGVEAIEVSNTSVTDSDGNAANATFDSVSLTSDVEKRHLQLGLTVDTLESNAVVEVRVIDADGDYVRAEINTSRSSGEDFIANQTGDGYLYQRQIGKMSVMGSGDGTMQEIQTVKVRIESAGANVDLMLLNVDRMSKYKFGEEKVDSDGDDDLETESITESKTPGAISVHSLSSLGSTFDGAEIRDLTFPAKFRASDLESDMSKVNASYSKAEQYSGYEWKTSVYYRLTLPDAYDLSYSNAELTDDVELPGSRYVAVEMKEGAGDTNFSDLSWTTTTSSYDTQGANVTLDGTVTAGTSYALKYEYVITDSEKSDLESTGSGGPAPSAQDQSFIDWLIGLPGALVATVMTALGMKARKSGS